ncbi:MAG: carboxymuconolactone decarboxylase family protein [Methanobrevibacter sp.]|nr:carboxymuconolactone decarboxylase family protein [Methanobrevibacter sp.]
MSKSFEVFASEAPEVQKAWMEMAEKLDKKSALDKKTEELSYISVLSAVGLESGIPFHTSMVKANGASRDEIISSILLGLPAVGSKVIKSLPIGLEAYDNLDLK